MLKKGKKAMVKKRSEQSDTSDILKQGVYRPRSTFLAKLDDDDVFSPWHLRFGRYVVSKSRRGARYVCWTLLYESMLMMMGILKHV